MATSIRKIRVPPIEIKSAFSEDERVREKRPERKKDRKGIASFHRAPDRYSFAHLAKVLTGGERLAMLSAVDRLKGRSRVLVELALFSNFAFVRLAAVSHLSNDPEALIDIAKFCHYEDTRASAVDELSNKGSALVEVACSSLFGVTRMDAVRLLVEPEALSEVAARSPHRDSRTAAMEKISENAQALRKVAEQSSFRSVRMNAVDTLSSDIDSLCSLVLSKHSEVKKAAAAKLSAFVEELDDVEALIEIAKISPSEDARYIAVGRLSNDPFSLRTVISDSEYGDAKTTALMLLSDMVADLDDSEVLSDVAMLSPYPDCRSAAVERLVGQSNALLSVASKSKFKDSRELALVKLKGDVDALKSVSKLSKYSDTRKKAHSMVAKPEVFASELARILG
ncbi:hypothetical protein L0Y65_01705 [Candidatus Micrarchaeota archaeon]|nr:hypothetical protein [Candidatus Micrarchaeota archaeon]